MSSHLPGPRRSRVVAATLLGILAAGCYRPLALQHEYFRPTSGPVARTSMQVQHTVSHQLALQAAQRACATPVPAAPPSREAAKGGSRFAGPDLGSPAAREALAEVCAGTVARTAAVSAHGATSDAHRRWVEDQVRELPAPSETASSIGGG